VLETPRIARRWIERVVRRTDRAPFIRRELAHDDRAALNKAVNDVGVVRRDLAYATLRAGCGRKALDIDHVFDADRDAVQRATVAAGRELGIGTTGSVDCSLGVDHVEAEIVRVAIGDPRLDRLLLYERCELTSASPLAGFADREVGHVSGRGRVCRIGGALAGDAVAQPR